MMRKLLLYFLILCNNIFFSQTIDSVQAVHAFQIGAGRIINTLSLQENFNEVIFLTGWDFNANYMFKNLTRLEFKFCNFENTDILPFWNKAHLQNFNLNYHLIISNEKGSLFIYPNFGLALSKFNAYQILNPQFQSIDQNKTFYTYGLNAGLGAEIHFKYFSLFADYNMRFTQITPKSNYSLKNVGFSFGARLFYIKVFWRKEKNNSEKISAPTPQSPINPEKPHKKKRKRKKLFDFLHDRYHWF